MKTIYVSPNASAAEIQRALLNAPPGSVVERAKTAAPRVPVPNRTAKNEPPVTQGLSSIAQEVAAKALAHGWRPDATAAAPANDDHAATRTDPRPAEDRSDIVARARRAGLAAFSNAAAPANADHAATPTDRRPAEDGSDIVARARRAGLAAFSTGQPDEGA